MKAKDGLSVCNADYIFHRFLREPDGLGERDVEHFMLVEKKEPDEKLGLAQRDTLTVCNRALNQMRPVDGTPIGVKSRPGFIRPGVKKVQYHGAHLLRVPSPPLEGAPYEKFIDTVEGFYWDNRRISSWLLSKVLSFINDPSDPEKRLDTGRRHKKSRPLCWMCNTRVKERVGKQQVCELCADEMRERGTFVEER